MTILDSLRDPHLFGGPRAFRDLASWRAWEAFLAASYAPEQVGAELSALLVSQ